MTVDQALAFSIVVGMMALFIWGRLRYDVVALLSLLAGLDDPTEGRLHVAGYDLLNLSETRKNTYRRTVVGMIFQSFNLLPTMSVMENVCLPALLAGELAGGETDPTRADELRRIEEICRRVPAKPARTGPVP